MARRLSPNRPELAVLRGKRRPDNIESWLRAFAEGDEARAQAWLTALRNWLGDGPEGERYLGGLSPATRRAYAFALAEFFEWLAVRHDRVMDPLRVAQADAEGYTQWLSTRPFGLTKTKLQDGDLEELRKIYETVAELGPSHLDAIAQALPPSLSEAHSRDGRLDRGWLHQRLGRMVLRRMLSREPTLGELRRSQPQLGITEWDVFVPGQDDEPGDRIPLPDVYRYQIPKPVAVSRATVAARVAALSTFWDVALNSPPVGGKPLVTHNPWYVVGKRVARGLRDERRLAARSQRIRPELVARLLATADRDTSPVGLRDRALLYLLVLTGMRVSEVIRLRRGPPLREDLQRTAGWFEGGEPAALVLTRKGGKRVRLPYPPLALRALGAMQDAFAQHAAHPDAQSDDRHALHYLAAGSIGYRYRMLATSSAAPLLPPLAFWGANVPWGGDTLAPLTRHGVHQILQRLGGKAGFTRAELRQCHPHALRHFALSAMAKGGKPIREIQAIAGHESLTTTEQYLEDPLGDVALSGQREVLAVLAEVAGVEPAPESAAQQVETTGISLPERPRTPLPEVAAARPERTRAKAPEPPPERADEEDGLPVPPAYVEPAAKAVPTGAGQAVQVADRVVSVDGKDTAAESDEPDELQLIKGKSAGSPDWVYVAMDQAHELLNRIYLAPKTERTKLRAALRAAGRETIHFTSLGAATDSPRPEQPIKVKIQKEPGEVEQLYQHTPWLAEHYHPWPLSYDIGEQSLLAWYARGNPTKEGYLRIGKVDVSPLPVLSPNQVSPETREGAALLDAVEQLYQRWLTGEPEAGVLPSPTRTFGLVKWWAFFAYASARLSRYLGVTGSRVSWQSWDGVAELGAHVRAHSPEWLADWLATNAHTYTTAKRHFAAVPRGKGLVDEDDFWMAFEGASFEGLSLLAEIPDWFAVDDPIAALPPVEYDQFAKWIANVTGQRMSRTRQRARSAEAEADAARIERTRAELEGLLGLYLDDVVSLAQARAKRDKDEARVVKSRMQAMEARFGELGLPSPTSQPFVDIERHADRIKALLDAWLSEQGVEPADDNVFAASPLFDQEALRLDRLRHTISHTPEFKAEFQRQHGQDSELLVRRAARGMWEHIKAHKLNPEKLPASKYTLLYSVYLSYLSWVVPAGADMERAMAARGMQAVPAGAQRRQWLESQAAAVRDLVLREGEPASVEGDLVEQIVKRHGLDQESAAAAIRQARLLDEHLAGEQARGSAPELAGALAAGEHVIAPRAARGGRMVANGRHQGCRITLVHLQGEQVDECYLCAANEQSRVYLSNGAWQASRAASQNARDALPSPFRMIQAMTALYPKK